MISLTAEIARGAAAWIRWAAERRSGRAAVAWLTRPRQHAARVGEQAERDLRQCELDLWADYSQVGREASRNRRQVQ
jgi:hypothetical protein